MNVHLKKEMKERFKELSSLLADFRILQEVSGGKPLSHRVLFQENVENYILKKTHY